MSKPPYIRTMEVGGKKIASVVMDREDFEALVAEIRSLMFSAGSVPEESIAAILKAGFVPAIGRGTKTKFIFDRFDILPDVDIITLCERGFANRILEQQQNGDTTVGMNPTENN